MSRSKISPKCKVSVRLLCFPSGITEKLASEIADFLEFKDDLKLKAAMEVQKLWKLFLSVDATQLEINPLVETDDKEVISVDAKINFDDNAEFRQKNIFSQNEVSESDPREVDASKYNLNYVGMEGELKQIQMS